MTYSSAATTETTRVLRWADCDRRALACLLQRFGIDLVTVDRNAPIPGSFWGDEEAGLVGSRLLARLDTPVHSILHETCHFICMDCARRRSLDTDAGGDYDEENAVCYLQILLADELPDVGRIRIMTDMDLWGYGFRLGSARNWFERDAEDARAWLIREGLIDATGAPTYRLRDTT